MLMKNSNILKAILFLCGLLIIVPGVMAIFSTDYFAGRNGIDIAGNISLYNDYKAMGGIMIGAGIVMWLGIIHPRMAFTSTVVAMVTHLSIALGRYISIAMDGMPADGLFKASIAETVLGLLAVFALVKYREKALNN